MPLKFTEVETKYSAEDISFEKFKVFCEERLPEKRITASGYDHFYEKNDDVGSFCRHRIGPDMNQLTFKRKTKDANNFIRVEHNINLTKDMGADIISALCSEFGYKYNTSIFKTCFVYTYKWYVFSYYTCYDTDMREVGRFIEIEMREDHAWKDEKEAWDNLLVLEKLCKSLGLSPQARIKKSLFEIYRKDRKS